MPGDEIDVLIEQSLTRAAELRRWPVSTYRLQFHAGFTFRDATKILPYLAKLGITHVYASPYLAATKGSTHGYDVIDHCRLNPELGTQADYDAFLAGLAGNGLAHILDTVPNHVGVATNDNTWWNDVLEYGPASQYATYFDITWESNSRPELKNKVLIPTLGKAYGQAIEDGELKLSFDPKAGRFWLNYFERRFPITPSTYEQILSAAADESHTTELHDLIASIRDRKIDGEAIKSRLAELASKPGVAEQINRGVAILNGKPGDVQSFERLDRLLADQCFRLADWHVAFDEINYRRFFDVNDLAALSMERPEVFEATHSLILPLLAEGKIAGLRIDHPDGLYDPAGYLRRLQTHFILAIAQTLYRGSDWENARAKLLQRLESFQGAGEGAERWPLFVSVEKILAMNEPLDANWATQGTSGYDFLVMLNSVQVNPAAEQTIDTLWKEVTHDETSFAELANRNKRMMMETSLASELHALTHRLDQLAQKHRRSVDFTFRTLQTAIRETVACFGVYRTYIDNEAVSDIDRQRVNDAIEKAKQRNPRVQPGVFEYLRDTLLQVYREGQDEEERGHQLRFAGKFQQLTSPVTAKGIEDTTFYQYNRFLSLNEVGGEPGEFGITPARFHDFLADRQRHWPFALSALSTHDTKRSEDVRARLNVLADLPEEWAEQVRTWFKVNASLRKTINGHSSPAPDEELLIYQTLLGAWPLDQKELPAFADRVQAYLLKALREAKSRTRWGHPDEAHEKAVADFAAALLDPARSSEFQQSFGPFCQKVSHLGLLNSLNQTLIKLTAPGVPDTYQGCDLWDFSLVDPDNRRPVDYGHREKLLADLETAKAADLLANLPDGRMKLKLTAEVLRFRRDHADLFLKGDYQPLKVTGQHAERVFGFTRSWQGQTIAVITPLGAAQLARLPGGTPIGTSWGDTQLALPPAGKWRDLLTGLQKSSNRLADLLSDLPFAMLIAAK